MLLSEVKLAILPYLVWIKVAAIAILCLGVWWGTSNFYGNKIDLINKDHQIQLLTIEGESKNLALRLETLNNSFEQKLDEKRTELDANYEKKVKYLQYSVGQLADIRLRDPYSGKNDPNNAGGNPGGASDGNGSSSTELSRTTSQFLLGLAADADATRERLKICQEWVAEVKASNTKQRAEVQKIIDEADLD